jgi:signal transduction histidine kinase
MRTGSIRFRLTAWYALILTAGLGLFGGLVWFSLRQQLIGDVDRDLAGRASRFESYFRAESAEGAGAALRDELEEFCQALPPDSYIEVRGTGGFSFRYPAGRGAAPADLRMLQRQFTVQGRVFDLEVGAPITSVRRTLELLRLLLWSLIPVEIFIACLGGAWLSGRALKPVRDVTASALTISIENLSERLPVPPTGDELAQLAVVLNSMLARLESAVQTLSQFAADASHELRTPLAVIRTTAELALRRGRTPESYRESLQTVAGEAERMTGLIEDLLILARGQGASGEGAAAQVPREPVEVREVLREVCSEMRGLAEARGIAMKEELGDAVAVVSGNRAALHRLFLVLLDNALKYSHSGGDVVLTVDHAGGHVSVTVQDFGSGIAATDLPHIFQRFYRASPSRTGGGHGLGLSFAESIAHAHDANIEVDSVEGAGSRFRVVFPARDLPPAPFSQSSASASTLTR